MMRGDVYCSDPKDMKTQIVVESVSSTTVIVVYPFKQLRLAYSPSAFKRIFPHRLSDGGPPTQGLE